MPTDHQTSDLQALFEEYYAAREIELNGLHELPVDRYRGTAGLPILDWQHRFKAPRPGELP